MFNVTTVFKFIIFLFNKILCKMSVIGEKAFQLHNFLMFFLTLTHAG